MKTKLGNFILLLTVGLLTLTANCGSLIYLHPILLIFLVPLVIAIHALPLLAQRHKIGTQLWFITYGNHCLKIFFISTIVSIFYQVPLAFTLGWDHIMMIFVSVLVCFCILAVTFYTGIVIIYCTSYQLGLKLRILGIWLGLVPIANIIILIWIIMATDREVTYENQKDLLNQKRENQKICSTKYPILLVHGVFFRDYKYFDYWGRIPGQLKRNGATVYYGMQPSADSIANCAQAITQRIKDIMNETGCEKVNIIAHSKGGLDCRYAMAFCGAAEYVASLTTISTPHRGSPFADYLFNKISSKNQERICHAYNRTLNKLGEPEADLMTAAQQLTTEYCISLDQQMPQPAGVYCQSFGSKMNKPLKGHFPMNFTGIVMRQIAKDNDGLVSTDSFPWGDRYTLLTSNSPIGISHGDMTDLNRTNLPDFDVREFYVQLVAELKEKGL